jgi:hypothetical protein
LFHLISRTFDFEHRPEIRLGIAALLQVKIFEAVQELAAGRSRPEPPS